MKCILSLMEKGIASRRRSWRWVLIVSLFLPLLAAFFFFSTLVSSPAFAASSTLLASGTSSPTQGPVGAVIVVTGSAPRSPDGTKIDLGYSTDFANCTAATDTQPGIVKNRAFSGWFRWPASTGTGNFEVCASVDGSNNPFMVGNYQVLSATPPQISLVPTTPGAGKQATITGANFLPAGTSVNLVWPAANGLPAISLGTVSSDGTGAFSQTFTIPAHAITGSYGVTAASGSGQPPTMSASTTFHVNGITIVAVPTPTSKPTSTATPTATATVKVTSNALGTDHPANINGNSSDTTTTGNTNLLLPIALIGLVVIIAALVAGVFVVRKQRGLALVGAAASGGSAWPGASGMAGAGAFAPAGVYQASTQSPPGNSMLGRLTRPHKAVMPDTGKSKSLKPIPFDPGLAEAMRQAQVSLFATPRPPVGEEVPS